MNGFKLNQLPSCVKTGIVCYLALVLMVIAFPFYMMSQEEAEENAGHKAELRTGGVAYAHGVESEEAEEAAESQQGAEKEEGHGDEVSEHLLKAAPVHMMSQEEAEENAEHKAELRTGDVAYAHGVESEEAEEAAKSQQGAEKEEEHGDEVSEDLLKAAHVHLGGHTLLLFTVGLLFAFTTLSSPIKGAVFVISALSVVLHTIGLVEMQVLGKGVVGGSVLIYVLTILFMIAAVLREMLMRER